MLDGVNPCFSSEIVIGERHTRICRDRFIAGIAESVAKLSEFQRSSGSESNRCNIDN